MPPLLQSAEASAATPIRGAARLLRRSTSVRRGGARLRLFGRSLSRALPSLSPRSPTRVLHRAPARTAHPAEKVGRARVDRATAQEQLLGIRDQHHVEG